MMANITEYPTPEQGVELSPRELSLLMAEDPVVIEIILDEEFGVIFTDEFYNDTCGGSCPQCGGCHHTCRCYNSYGDTWEYGNPSYETLLRQQKEDAAFEEEGRRDRRRKMKVQTKRFFKERFVE